MAYGHRISTLRVNASSSGTTSITVTGNDGCSPRPHAHEGEVLVLRGRLARKFHDLLAELGV